MVTDQQVRRLMTLLKEGSPLIQAAVRAGMSEPTARKYARSGLMPSRVKMPHTWRTRPDAEFPRLRTRRFPGLRTTGFPEFRTS